MGRVSDQRFAASKHRYTDPRTGERVIGVTSIVGCFDPGDKLGAGAGAAVKLTKEGKDYRAEWNAKRDLGSRVHGYASLWIAGKTADVPDTDAAHMDAFAAWCDEYEPEWIATEREVVHSAGYGGKFDAIAGIGDDFVLLDLKTGKPYKTELTLQLAGYRYADGMIVYDADGWAIDLEDMPHVDYCAGLYLDGEGKATFVPVEADEAAHARFLDLLRVKTWAKELDDAAKVAAKEAAAVTRDAA